MGRAHRRFWASACLVLLAGACRQNEPAGPAPEPEPPRKTVMAEAKPSPSPIPAPFQDTDLVSLADIDPSIRIEMQFATAEHPFGRRFYRNHVAYLRYGTARKLAAVQEDLRQKGLGLKIWDAYRPFVVQEALFHAAGGNPLWVSDPHRSSGKKTHVRGVAVDCTIIDASGNELEMPTPYLDFENGAERMKHTWRDLPQNVLANRRLLMETMMAHGMELYTGEWWHYQDTDWAKYPVISLDEFPEVHRRLLVEELLSRKPTLSVPSGKMDSP